MLGLLLQLPGTVPYQGTSTTVAFYCMYIIVVASITVPTSSTTSRATTTS